MTYSADYERALQYARDEDTNAVLRAVHHEFTDHKSHRYPKDSLSGTRAAAADKLLEAGREDEYNLLSNPKQHVMIKKGKGDNLTVHPAKWDLSELWDNLDTLRNFIDEHRDYGGPLFSESLAFSHIPGLDIDSLNKRNPNSDGRTSEDRRFIRDYRQQLSDASERELQEMGVDRDISDEEILPAKLPDDHIRFYHYNNQDYADFPTLPRHEDVHIKNVPNYVHDFINSDHYLDAVAQAEGFPVEELEHHLDAVKNSPVERSLTTSEKQPK
jgi:hypothetical protein